MKTFIRRWPFEAKAPGAAHAKGFTLIELIIVLMIAAFALVQGGWLAFNAVLKAEALDAAGQLNTIGLAVQSFITANPATVNAAATTTVTLAQLQAANSCGTGITCLSAAINPQSPWGSAYSILIRRNGSQTPYQIEFLVTTTGTNASFIVNGNTRTDILGNAIMNVGSQLGMTTNVGVGGLRAVGASGTWTATTTNYSSLITAPGQLAYFFTQVGLPYDSVYLRVDGGNKMNANLNMGTFGMYQLGQGINDPSVVAASSSTSGNNDIYVTGNVNVAQNTNSPTPSTTGMIQMTSSTGDILMSSLQNGSMVNGGAGYATKSVTALLPKLSEVVSTVGQNNSVVPALECTQGGTANIFIIPSAAISPVYNGNTGYTFKAVGTSPGPWTMSITDANGVAVAGTNIAIAKTFCAY